ncbi:MAG: polyprenyl synthetase family protein [Anaerolineae bacterium]
MISVLTETTDTTAELFIPVQQGLAAVEVRLREVAASQHDALTTATEHMLNSGGKRIRPAISLLAAGIFAADFDRSVALAAAVEMLHTATLVHDDLIDGALLRRGIPTLNAEWSPHATILTGDYLFARAASLVAQTDTMSIMDLFARTLMVIVDGEIRQKFSSRRLTSRDDYYARIYAKTAAMFMLCTRAAGVLGNADETSLNALSEFGREVGMAFQIVDDVLDFVGTPDQIGKPVGSDLRQGLFTLPAIYYIEANPDDPDANALLNGRVGDRSVVSRVVAAVRESGAADEALQEAREFVARGQLALGELPDSEYVDTLVAVSNFIVSRNL